MTSSNENRNSLALRSMQARMFAAAFESLDLVDPRTSAFASAQGLVETKTSNEDRKAVETELSNKAANPSIESVGPVLIYRRGGPDSTDHGVIRIVDLLLGPESMMRKAALEYCRSMIWVAPETCSLRTRRLIEEARNQGDAPTARQLTELCDALDSDWVMNLQGFDQCARVGFTVGCRDHLLKLLRPSIDAIDAMDVPVRRPSHELVELRSLVSSLGRRQNDVVGALDEYSRCLGHVPLKQELSLGSVIVSWIGADTSNISDIWRQCWEWTEKSSDVAGKLQMTFAWLFAARNVPIDSVAEDLEKRTVDLLEDWDNGYASGVSGGHSFARYYAQYLEMHIPGADGEALSNLAWKLAFKLHAKLRKFPEMANALTESVISVESENTHLFWRLSSPIVAPSVCEFGLRTPSDIWVLSLLEAIGSTHIKGVRSERFEELIRRAIASVATCPLLWRRSAEESSPYAFDSDVLATVDAWAGTRGVASEDDVLEKIRRAVGTVLSNANWSEALSCFAAEDEPVQIAATRAAHLLAYERTIDAQNLWKAIENYAAAKKVLGTVTEVALDQVFLCATEMQKARVDEWRKVFPHLIATLCEDVTIESKRRGELLTLQMVNGTAMGTLSAVERVVRGPRGDDFGELVKQWIDRVRDRAKTSPPIAFGRSRALIGLLSNQL